MLYKLFIAAVALCCITVTAQAQDNDSLFVIARGDHWCIAHEVQPGETLFMLSRRFHVPPAILAGENSLGYKSNLEENSTVYVPIGGYNILKNKPQYMGDARELYHRVTSGEKFSNISHNSEVSQRMLEDWNHLPDDNVGTGDVLFVGWVLYDATQIAPEEKKKPIQVIDVEATPVQHSNNITYTEAEPAVAPQDTTTIMNQQPVQPEISNVHQLYIQQTDSETHVTREKGAAAFFEGGMHSDVYYAFHNNTPKGTIIKVYNPGTGKTVYVKVLGPLPPTKQYYNCIIGISAAAKKDLGMTVERKAWCDLTFAAQ